MYHLSKLPIWQQLQQHYQHLQKVPLTALFAQDPSRFDHFSLSAANLFVDFSKNLLTAETLSLLLELAEHCQVSQALQALANGAIVNQSEQRAAMHMALRNLEYPAPEISAVLEQMAKLIEKLNQNSFTDIVNIGIGGSDLGPSMVCQALAPFAITNHRMHFVSNLDPSHISETLAPLDPDKTFFIVSSKTFTTQETLSNANFAKQWLSKRSLQKHMVAVTANKEAALSFGINSQNIFPIWSWVGGRYSVWSAIGLPVAIKIGMDRFREFLSGAHAMDTHVLNSPLSENLPVILALMNIWYTNFFGASTHAILPYDQHLSRLPAYLQQLEMESNGKSIRQDGSNVDYQTGPIIWGEPGTNGQHAFYQLLHQGTEIIPVDFIIARKPQHQYLDQHALLFAHCLSQSQALMTGRHEDLPAYQQLPGNRPSTTIILPELNPYNLGALIALYEHKVYISATIWGINAFDQWGVELGKQLARIIYPFLTEQKNSKPAFDSSTNGLIKYFQQQETQEKLS